MHHPSTVHQPVEPAGADIHEGESVVHPEHTMSVFLLLNVLDIQKPF
jgi:hypothetical protein